MDLDGSALFQRGSEFGERAVEVSRASLQTRVNRLRDRLFFIIQIGIAAGLAWWVTHSLLGHPTPFFAPVTAAICLGMSYGHRLTRATELVVGVALGVLIGDLFTHFFGGGAWQLVIAAIVAMCVTTLLGAGILMTTQAGIQAIVVVTLVAAPGQALSRWLDAVVGGSVAITLTLILPAAPIRRPREAAAAAVRELAAILRSTAAAMRRPDADDRVDAIEDVLERARASDALLTRLREASTEGMAVVRLSFFRRRDLPGVQQIHTLLDPLDRAVRNVRVLIRRCSVASRRGETVPEAYLALIDELADLADDMARILQERQLPEGLRARLVDIGIRTAQPVPDTTFNAEVVRAQIRSTVTDLLMLTGLTYTEAFDAIPAIPDDD